jgi:hypothetical protein
VQDLQANMTTIQNSNNWDDAYVTVTDQTSGQDYYIIASDNGWMWSYTTQISTTDAGGKTQTQCVVQSGTYTKNAQMLGLSHQTLTNVPTEITALAASMIVASVAFNYIKQYILQGIFERALAAALAAAAEDAVAGGFMVDAAAAGIVASIGAGLAAGVIGAIVAVIIFYVADFLHRSYGLSIAVYNWDTQSSWNITTWYGDNAVVSQETAADGPWRAATLLPVQSKCPRRSAEYF